MIFYFAFDLRGSLKVPKRQDKSNPSSSSNLLCAWEFIPGHLLIVAAPMKDLPSETDHWKAGIEASPKKLMIFNQFCTKHRL